MAEFPQSQRVIDDLVSDLSATSGDSQVVNAPFTGEKLFDLPLSSLADVQDAAGRARLAQLQWWGAGFSHRRRVLLRAHDLLLKRQELILDLIQAETGKARLHAFEDLGGGINTTRYNALSAPRVLRRHRRRALIPLLYRTRVDYQPKGLIGVITPWNYPVSLGVMDAGAALAAGNAVLHKADSQAALSVLAARRAFIDAGLPADLWAVVTGPGATIGDAIVTSVDYVSFTGSSATGIHVGRRALESLTGASLELGGKNPMIVLDDVNIASVAKDAAFASFASMGQLCVSTERLYVHRRIFDEFAEAFAETTSALRQGAAYDNSTDMGSLTIPAQLERVDAHVKDAVAKGATVLAGGEARPDLGPLFYEPTVLTGVSDDAVCRHEETFGPVVALYPFDTDDEAVLAANDTEFGLNASIFSGSRRRARRLAAALNAGSVNINEGFRATFGSADAPMGGMKHSGLGRRNGPEGLLRFVEPRTVSESRGLFTLARTGREARAVGPLTVATLRVLKALRMR